nr:phototropin-2 [Quercus suber]
MAEKARATPSNSSSRQNERRSIGVFEPAESKKSNSSETGDDHRGSTSLLGSSSSSSISREASVKINKWMAFEPHNSNGKDNNNNNNNSIDIDMDIVPNIKAEAGMAERIAEWGLVVKSESDVGEGSFKKAGKGERLLILGGESTRTSEESNRGSFASASKSASGDFPRLSQELKTALSTLQQTFVVSDAAKPDCPIMYASSGFFSMTGYSSKEVIGRNCFVSRMQVEVSKYTEGINEKALRPNGLPKSLIRYDARQKEKALGSITEVVQTVKHPRSHTQATNRDTTSKHDEQEKFDLDYIQPKSAEIQNISTPGGQTPQSDYRDDVSRSSLSQEAGKKSRKSGRVSLMGFKGRSLSSAERQEQKPSIEPEVLMTKDIEHTDSWDCTERERDIRQGIDLATTLERIEKNFVISDPRLPDNPIIFASDSFLELTEYTREEILGRNCRFLQGPETDQATVSKIRDAIRAQREITVQLINYTKSGKKFWNLFHLQPMRDQKGELQYFIGVQLDGSDHVEPLRNRLSEHTEQQSSKSVKATAETVDEAVRELPDANLTPDDLWAIHSRPVFPKPHRKDSPSWIAIQKITARGEKIGLRHFKPIRPLGCGDTGSVHLVELQGTGELYAMKAMEKSIMLNRNKVHRACIEREIISLLDHPFLPTLYTSFQTSTHVCLITDFCPGGELFALLDKQPMKLFKEDSARFYAAEVVIALEYLHCLGIIYRDLKPENILLQKDGHAVLTDFDLSFMTSCEPQIIKHPLPSNRRRSRSQPPPTFFAEPVAQSNSFVGTEEYIAPEIITGAGHSSAIDWWALGILLYEMLYGRTPFRGKNRQKTFANILHKDLTFPSSISVSLAARQLINALLQRDPVNRLGSNTGANEIKGHPFFRGINWPLIRCTSPPLLDVPLAFIGKDPNAKEVHWEDDGVLVNSMDMEVF